MLLNAGATDQVMPMGEPFTETLEGIVLRKIFLHWVSIWMDGENSSLSIAAFRPGLLFHNEVIAVQDVSKTCCPI